MNSVHGSQKEILRSAAIWYSVLCSDDVTERQKLDHGAWLNADPAHGLAWQQVEKLREQLQSVPGSPSIHALQIKQRQDHSRRTVLRGFALLATAAAFGGVAWQQAPVSTWTASHRTGRGDRREYILADGTQLILNTATTLDVLEVAGARLIRLYEGEIYIRTGKSAPPGRPTAKALQVHTEQGVVLPLGTVFTVRCREDLTEVAVIEDQIELMPLSGGGYGRRVVAGEQARMSSREVSVAADDVLADSWTRGLLVAVDWPLSRLVAELGRYRSGVLRCDPAVAGLRVSGAFPVDDTERALQAITNALPVRVDSLTRYWVTIRAPG